MVFILIATVALGLGAAGLVFALGRLVPGGLPRWLAPVAGGLAMFAFLLWNEYTWYERAVAALRTDTVVAQTFEHQSVFQPWTLAAPRIVRFAAVDLRRREHEGMKVGTVILRERFMDERRIPHMFDCQGERRAALSPEQWDGLLSGYPPPLDTLDWIDPGSQDALIDAACKSGRSPTEDRP